MRESSSFKIAKTKAQAVAERALTYHTLGLALLFLAKELFPMVRGEVRLSCSSWAGHEAICNPDVDTRSNPRPSLWAWLLGLLSFSLFNKNMSN